MALWWILIDSTFPRGVRLFFPCCTRRKKWEKLGKNEPKIGQKSKKKIMLVENALYLLWKPEKNFSHFSQIALAKRVSHISMCGHFSIRFNRRLVADW
jgi:hypothetical protein